MLKTFRLPIVGGVLLIATAAGLAGCTGPTYINIPPQRGDLARDSPNGGDVVDIMSKSLAAAIEAEGVPGVYEVLLPEGASQQTYQEVVLRLGGGAITPDTLREAPVPSVAVAGVRVRGKAAEVDIVRPSPTGRAAVMVELEWYVGEDWAVTRVRPLRLSVEALGWAVPTEAVPSPLPPGVALPEAEPESEPLPPTPESSDVPDA
ncbi:MAG: hypothetical protein AAGE65_05380 [Planctomycetota bacterium]